MEQFEQQLVNLFNISQLPLEAKRYVVLAFYRNVEDAYEQYKLQNLNSKESEVDEKEIEVVEDNN